MQNSRQLLTLSEVKNKFTKGPISGIFTDGSCTGNPGPGGWGLVYVKDDEIIDEKFGFDDDTTNNRMEITAVMEALKLVQTETKLSLFTDSQLVVNTFMTWAANWEKLGWVRKTGPIKNLDLVQNTYKLIKKLPDVELQWIPAHSGYKWNEYADALSTAYLRDEL